MGQTALSSEPPPTPRRTGRWFTILFLLALGGALLWRGLPFYGLGLTERSAHPDYHLLKPSGFVGHGYGIVGTALILTNLLYLVRRRFARYVPPWAGSMKAWLNAHAFTGLVGALLVLFHSAFQLRTAIATLTSACLFIVVVTGLIGFYIYALVPKSGVKLMKSRLEEIRPLLPGFVSALEALVASAPVTRLPHDASLVRTLLTLPHWVRDARARRRALRQAARTDKMFRILRNTEPDLAKAILGELNDLLTSEVDAQAGASMMRSWRSLHRFLAVLMIVSVSVHIGVAWFYGFRWIFER
jgi:hypothetical protein